eukprot:8305793-Alexandrium_andersonii.AAC.1
MAHSSGERGVAAAARARAQTAVLRARAGNVRAAVQALVGGGAAEGTSETAAQLRGLVLEHPPEAETEEAFAEELERRAEALKVVGPPVVHPRA